MTTEMLELVFVGTNRNNQNAIDEDISKLKKGIDFEKSDVVIIASSEAKKRLTHQLKKHKNTGNEDSFTAREDSFRTLTKANIFSSKSYGRVAQTILSEDPDFSARGRIVQHSDGFGLPNKGGLYATVTIKGHIFGSISAHLSSYSFENRFEETYQLMRNLENQITAGKQTDYDRLLTLATTPIIFGGDLNYRNLIHDGNVTTPEASKFNLMHHFALWGLIDTYQPSSPNTELTTYYKNKDMQSKDPKRPGETLGGRLDRVYYRGITNVTTKNVTAKFVEQETSDHDAIITKMSLSKPPTDEAEQMNGAKKHLLMMIRALEKSFPKNKEDFKAIKDHIKNINDNTDNNRLLLGKCYKQLEDLREKAFDIERFRMQQLDLKRSKNIFKKIYLIISGKDGKRDALYVRAIKEGKKKIQEMIANQTQDEIQRSNNQIASNGSNTSPRNLNSTERSSMPFSPHALGFFESQDTSPPGRQPLPPYVGNPLLGS